MGICTRHSRKKLLRCWTINVNTEEEVDNKEDKQDDKVTDLTDTQKAQKLTADNKKEQTKVGNKQINKE